MVADRPFTYSRDLEATEDTQDTMDNEDTEDTEDTEVTSCQTPRCQTSQRAPAYGGRHKDANADTNADTNVDDEANRRSGRRAYPHYLKATPELTTPSPL
jgi:hypothetical protein